jgi:hypothetical protein
LIIIIFRWSWSSPGLIFSAAVEFSLLLAISMSGLASEFSGFCVIAALIIAFDCMFMFSLFLPVLTLHIEERKVRHKANTALSFILN